MIIIGIISYFAYIRSDMMAILTGDIVNSAAVDTAKWMPVLKRYLSTMGKSPKNWEIFRGDSFQFACDPKEAFQKFLLLKSIVRQQPELDVRVSIGIGEMDFRAARISESNGTAFVRSGRAFDQMQEKQYLIITTGDEEKDRTFNLLCKFASLIMDNWSTVSAETVQVILENPKWNQQQIADKLKVNQSAVSQNRKRAQFDLLMEFDEYFRTTVTSMTQ